MSTSTTAKSEKDIEGTTEEKLREKKKRQKGAKRGLDISMVAIADNIVFSKTDMTAYYRIENSVFDFLDPYEKERYAKDIMNAFASLFSNEQEPLECFWISTSTPVDIDLWEQQVEAVTKTWDRSPNFAQYVEEQSNFLRQKEYHRKVSYLGIKIGKRGALDLEDLNVFEMGWTGVKNTLGSFFKTALQTPGYEISEEEESDARRKEVEKYRILRTGSLRAQRATTEEILLLMKRQLWPAMPTPYLNMDVENRVGAFDLALENASAIRKRYRWLEITQQANEYELTGYRATLSVAKMPKAFNFPNKLPFLYVPSRMGLPFTTYAHFKMLPNKKMKGELHKKQQEQKDQLENMAEGGHGMNRETAEDVHEMSELEYELSQDNHPWIEGSYRIVVETPTEETLKSFCTELRQQYSAMDIDLAWTAGDQMDLFLEQMPGDRLRVPSFNILTNLEILGVTGLGISNDIGDPLWGDADATTGT